MKRLLLLVVGCCALAGQVYAADPDQRVLTLDEALRLARASHPQLHAARAQTEASQAKVAEAKAPLLPQVNGIASYGRSTSNYVPSPGALPKNLATSTQTVTSTGTSTSTSTSTATSFSASSSSSWNTVPSYNAKITASELIYDFGQTTGKWNAAKATLRSQEENERNLGVQVAFNLRSAYYNAAAARALLKVAEETLSNQEAHLRQIQGFVEAGTRPEIDLAQARTDRANAKVQLINSQVAYDTDKALLNQTMGIERGTEYDVADPPVETVPGEDDGTDAILPVALKARPDLLALERQIEAQELTTKSIKGGYAPSLGVSTYLSDGGPDLGNLAWNWSATLGFNWQIFGGGITDAQMREARANTAVLRAQYDLQRQQVRADVEQARLGVRATKAAIEATHEAAVNARVRLGLAEGRYQAGVGSIIELGDSQVALTAAAGQEVQAVFNLASARARLLQALGQP
jgi:outer membrane protein